MSFAESINAEHWENLKPSPGWILVKDPEPEMPDTSSGKVIGMHPADARILGIPVQAPEAAVQRVQMPGPQAPPQQIIGFALPSHCLYAHSGMGKDAPKIRKMGSSKLFFVPLQAVLAWKWEKDEPRE